MVIKSLEPQEKLEHAADDDAVWQIEKYNEWYQMTRKPSGKDLNDSEE